MNKICMHCFVSGKVQGVFYRANTQKQAEQLGLTGWVKNLPDSRVETLFCGEPAQVEKLRAWLEQGPPSANVTGVKGEQVDYQEFDDFSVTG